LSDIIKVSNAGSSGDVTAVFGNRIKWKLVCCCLCNRSASIAMDNYTEFVNVKYIWSYNGDDLSYCPECSGSKSNGG